MITGYYSRAVKKRAKETKLQNKIHHRTKNG
jgi:hypothetical protein